MKEICCIYAIALKVFEKSLTVEEAKEMIRKILAPEGSTARR